MLLYKTYDHKYRGLRASFSTLELLYLSVHVLVKAFDLYITIFCKIKNYPYDCDHSSLYGHRLTVISGNPPG